VSQPGRDHIQDANHYLEHRLETGSVLLHGWMNNNNNNNNNNSNNNNNNNNNAGYGGRAV
jgi:hypothetical protein